MSNDLASFTDEILSGVTFAPFAPFSCRTKIHFPTDRLPAPLEKMVEYLSLATQTPEEMAGVLSIGVLSTLYQARYTVAINSDWTEPLCTWPVAIAPPGERKSSVLSALTKPIYEYEAELREQDAVEIEQNRVERSILEGQLETARKAAIKDAVEKRNALELSARLANFKDRHERRWIVDDTTPEKLVALMEQQNGCITMCSAEGGIFDAMQGRYDRTGNFDIYLKAHAGDPVVVDRIGRRSNFIQSPRLSMMLTIQPEVLSGLMKNSTFRGRGLCGRFLYAVCDSYIGKRQSAPPTIPAEVKEEYATFIRTALQSKDSGVIHLSREAELMRISFQDAIEEKLGDEWESMRDWGGKLVGTTIRIAALFHCASGHTASETISAENLGAAICVAAFLGDHASAAYQTMGANVDAEDAKVLWKKIRGRDQISKRELFNSCQSHFQTMANMEPALEILKSRGYLASYEQKTGGRPTTILVVNPEAK